MSTFATARLYQPVLLQHLAESDNLQALKALLPFYRGRVKCVFIDPPYDITNEEVATNLKALMPRLAKDAIVMLERSSRSGAVELPEGLELDEEKNFGDTTVFWLTRA